MAELTDNLRKTVRLLRQRGSGAHAGWVQEAIELLERRGSVVSMDDIMGEITDPADLALGKLTRSQNRGSGV